MEMLEKGTEGAKRAISPKLEMLKVKVLAETALMVGLSGVLYYIKVFMLPQGGAITLASMVPIFLLSLRRGPRVGIIGGAIFGLVALAEDQFVYNPFGIFLDYPLAFGLLGVAGFFREKPMYGIVVGTAARFCSHFVSGVLFFASYAWSGWNVYAYSAAYNAGFLIPELAMSLIIMTALIRARVLELYL